jgi:hypothetical protein
LRSRNERGKKRQPKASAKENVKKKMNLKTIKNSEKINKSNNCEAETKKGQNIRRRRNKEKKCKSNNPRIILKHQIKKHFSAKAGAKRGKKTSACGGTRKTAENQTTHASH